MRQWRTPWSQQLHVSFPTNGIGLITHGDIMIQQECHDRSTQRTSPLVKDYLSWTTMMRCAMYLTLRDMLASFEWLISYPKTKMSSISWGWCNPSNRLAWVHMSTSTCTRPSCGNGPWFLDNLRTSYSRCCISADWYFYIIHDDHAHSLSSR